MQPAVPHCERAGFLPILLSEKHSEIDPMPYAIRNSWQESKNLS
jgi:hypothetical protein